MTAQDWVYFFPAVSVLSLIVAFFFGRQVIGADQGTRKMHRIAGALKAGAESFLKRRYKTAMALMAVLLPTLAYGQTEHAGGGEANLILPDLSTVNFLGMNGHALLMIGLLFCVGGLLFGLAIYVQLKNLPVHRTMREISELIYETCKTYLMTQGKFILLLWVFIAVIISLYFGYLAPVPGKSIAVTLPIILLFRLVGIGGQLRGGVVRNSRQHLCELTDGIRRIARQAVSGLCNSAEGRHEHRHVADLGRTAHHAFHPSVHPARLCGPMLHRLRDWRKSWAPRPCVLPAASSPRSPTLAPT